MILGGHFMSQIHSSSSYTKILHCFQKAVVVSFWAIFCHAENDSAVLITAKSLVGSFKTNAQAGLKTAKAARYEYQSAKLILL